MVEKIAPRITAVTKSEDKDRLIDLGDRLLNLVALNNSEATYGPDWIREVGENMTSMLDLIGYKSGDEEERAKGNGRKERPIGFYYRQIEMMKPEEVPKIPTVAKIAEYWSQWEDEQELGERVLKVARKVSIGFAKITAGLSTAPIIDKEWNEEEMNQFSLENGIEKLNELLEVDESDPGRIRHSKDGPHKYRRAWFNNVRGDVGRVLGEVLGMGEFLNEDHNENSKLTVSADSNIPIDGVTTYEDSFVKETVDHEHMQNFDFPDSYQKVLETEEFVDDGLIEFTKLATDIFNYWRISLPQRITHKRDVEVGKQIVKLVLVELYKFQGAKSSME